jgi:hypothetical protein
MAALERSALEVFGEQTIRVEARRGGSVRVFISLSSFEAIPYPDRENVLKDLTAPWCANVRPWLLPRLAVVDIKTGKVLGSCLCMKARRRAGTGR